jgi:hypothetical protein
VRGSKEAAMDDEDEEEDRRVLRGEESLDQRMEEAVYYCCY